jgi:hypothetical protein
VSTDLRDDDTYAVLNAVVLKKMATPPAVSAATSIAPDTVRSVVADLTDDGLVAAAGDQVLPTNSAEPALADAAAVRYANLRDDAAVAELHADFERINTRFLEAMTSWQRVDVGGHSVPNTHDDPAYDDRVLTTIERLVDRLRDVVDRLAEHEPRFDTYNGRLQQAADRASGGDIAAVSSPTTDSIHNVWFEFHEDLLRTLGLEREE